MTNRPIVDEDVAEAINLTNLCRSLGCLPRSGGLLDQDSYHVYMMEAVLNAEQIKKERERG